MLIKQKLRALQPGQWALVKSPDFECWRKDPKPESWCRAMPGDAVNICIMPIYGPAYESEVRFEWRYQVAYRSPGSKSTTYAHPAGYNWISPHDFGLINSAFTSSPSWDKQTSDDYYAGKGKWLYEPASDDPELCPGGDWSRYLSDQCQKYVAPFSDDDGNPLCPWCDATGLVILDIEQLDRLEQVREFAASIGLSEQLERQLCYLHGYSDHGEGVERQCVLGYDFAPHSFSFAHFVLPASSKDGTRKLWFHGGLIYQGPTSPANGLGPSLCVSLATGTGWFCHT